MRLPVKLIESTNNRFVVVDAINYDVCQTRGQCAQKEDGEFIVRAVNSHAGLIAALEEIVAADESFGGKHRYAAIARAALAKARS